MTAEKFIREHWCRCRSATNQGAAVSRSVTGLSWCYCLGVQPVLANSELNTPSSNFSVQIKCLIAFC